jgi:hypothetical protein
MSKTKKNKSNRGSKKTNKNRKGTQNGQVGAPPKKTNWPNKKFTMAQLFARNTHQCELSLRNKVADGISDGLIVVLESQKQPGGAVGRPKAVFVLREHYDAAMMVRADKKSSKKSRVGVVQVTPAPVATDTVAETVNIQVNTTPAPEPVVVTEPAAVETATQTVAEPTTVA